jgi:hypothetical protein
MVNDVQYVANFNHGIGMVLPQKKLIQILLGRSSRRVTQKSLASNLAIQNEGYNQQKHRTTTLKWQGLTKNGVWSAGPEKLVSLLLFFLLHSEFLLFLMRFTLLLPDGDCLQSTKSGNPRIGVEGTLNLWLI